MDPVRTALVLARAPGVNARLLWALAERYGGLAMVLALTADQLARDPALPAATAAFLSSPDPARIDADCEWLRTSGARLLSVSDPDYPDLLRQIDAPPPFLFILGEVSVLNTPQLAIVGSRNPTASGRTTAQDFASYFALVGITITSGLALGIDTAAHEGALSRHGTTVAVCGTGLDCVYPPRNEALANRIAASGALVSEFPPGTRPLRAHFPQRNRIISGLALGTLVVEAARSSGSLITARHALEQGREVFAIPGSIHNPLARGCHKLIRDGAKLVEAAADVLSEIRFPLRDQLLAAPPSGAGSGAPAATVLDKEYEILLDALGFEPATIDSLTDTTGFSGDSVASMLLILELEGRVAPQPGGRYCRVP